MQNLTIKKLKSLGKEKCFPLALKKLTESTRRTGDGSLFHARGAATANERSQSDDVVRGTATVRQSQTWRIWSFAFYTSSKMITPLMDFSQCSVN